MTELVCRRMVPAVADNGKIRVYDDFVVEVLVKIRQENYVGGYCPT
jgi:hypothetical protein